MDIGSRIKEARKQAQLSQDGLARKAHVSLGAITQIEQGQRTDPHYSTLHKIANALDVSVSELLQEAGEPGKALAR